MVDTPQTNKDSLADHASSAGAVKQADASDLAPGALSPGQIDDPQELFARPFFFCGIQHI